MSEDAAIRRANFNAYCRARGWTPKDLPTLMGWGRYTFWRDLLNDARKSFGEKTARRIEARLDMTRGQLDEPPSGPRHGEVREAPRGPFTPELTARLSRCGDAQLRALENALRSLLDMPVLGSARRSGPADEARPPFVFVKARPGQPAAKSPKAPGKSAKTSPTGRPTRDRS